MIKSRTISSSCGTPCEQLLAAGEGRENKMRIRYHHDFGHGLAPGTDEDISCIACQRDKELGQAPCISGGEWYADVTWSYDTPTLEEDIDVFRADYPAITSIVVLQRWQTVNGGWPLIRIYAENREALRGVLSSTFATDDPEQDLNMIDGITNAEVGPYYPVRTDPDQVRAMRQRTSDWHGGA